MAQALYKAHYMFLNLFTPVTFVHDHQYNEICPVKTGHNTTAIQL